MDPIHSASSQKPIAFHKSDHLETPQSRICRTEFTCVESVDLVEDEIGGDLDPVEDFLCVGEETEMEPRFVAVDF